MIIVSIKARGNTFNRGWSQYHCALAGAQFVMIVVGKRDPIIRCSATKISYVPLQMYLEKSIRTLSVKP